MRRNAEKQANSEKAGDKGKETRKFEKLVITGRFGFINRETGKYKPKPGGLEGLRTYSTPVSL